LDLFVAFSGSGQREGEEEEEDLLLCLFEVYWHWVARKEGKKLVWVL
jgi:hypothetical protein